MCVIVLVTGGAVGGSVLFVELSCVAALTSGGAMGAEQRVFGVPFMVEEHGFPDLFAMALLALFSEVGTMDVVVLVAAIAVCCRLVFIENSLVAALAPGFAMVAFQRIRRVSLVVEEQGLPVPFGVAADTFPAESPFMGVVVLVAGITVDRGLVLIELPLVTGFTLRPKVSAEQWVLGV